MNTQNIAKYLHWGIYAVAVVPLLILSDFIAPFHFGKVVVFRFITELMLAGYLVLIWKNREYLPTFNSIFYSFLALVGAFFISSLTSVSFEQSIWGTLERMGGLWTFIHYFIYFVVLTSIVRTKDHWHKLFYVMIWVGFLSAIYGFGQKTSIEFFIGGPNRLRIFGTIGNAALFAGFQLINTFLALMLIGDSTFPEKKKTFLKIAAGIMTLSILMTAVRGSLIALGVGLLVIALMYGFRYKSVIYRKASYGLLGVVILLAIIAGLIRDTDFVKNSGYLSRITDFSLTSTTVQTRFWAWQAGIDGWNDSFKTILLGYGPENFNIPFSKHFNPNFFTGPGSETLYDRGHNMFVEVLVTMGLVGFLAYVFLLGNLIRIIWRLGRDSNLAAYSVGLMALVISYIIHNFFIFDTASNFIYFFTILGFTSFLISNRSNNSGPLFNPKYADAFLWLFILASLIVSYCTNLVPVRSNYTATRAIIAASMGSPLNEVVELYKKSLSYNTEQGKYEIRQKLAQYLFEQAFSGQNTSEALKGPLEFGVAEMEKTVLNNPLDYLPHLYLARLNLSLGKDDAKSEFNKEAQRNVEKALVLAPTFVRSYYELAQVYINQDDYDSAKDAFQMAIDLNPTAGNSYWYLGMLEMDTGDQKNGLQLIEEALRLGYNPDEQDYQRLAGIYIRLNDVKNVALIYEKLVQKDPNNPQYFATLAVAYSKLGRIDEAVQATRMSVQIDPSFRAEAEVFLRSLGRQL